MAHIRPLISGITIRTSQSFRYCRVDDGLLAQSMEDSNGPLSMTMIIERYELAYRRYWLHGI
ncbi:hypothetical protein AUEXF2481DRAFT_170910 [Aureobasidium subglaciale EXF-2481]|uniref:Uncharacterized protein n=1 Tax=Aureobasidium subglaciale (strain EXF-2481) TaxID=1043005 RepID=A0A074ZLM7_AURSE|nr:uncharacterized protein AUEXF2481DRAFT_170910 [Aureobasidium subglaciale EXF-2481]KEQ99321.1 hypothetical protein AUEXF2481DRAFT_170910 [Aureobasidium subglaciale EXF-2481]